MRFHALAAPALVVASLLISPSSSAALFSRASDAGGKPLIDETGRTLYFIDLDPTAFEQLPQTPPSRAEASRFGDWHSSRAIGAVNALERRFGFKHRMIASYTGNGFSAYLDQNQVEQVSHLPQVNRITEATTAQLSGYFMPWSDRNLPASMQTTPEISSWGRQAVNGGSFTTPPNDRPRVYVIDSGVAYHSDLSNVNRVNPNRFPDGSGYEGIVLPEVGCDSHATHVAGIIGADPGGLGSIGVAAGVNIVSVR